MAQINKDNTFINTCAKNYFLNLNNYQNLRTKVYQNHKEVYSSGFIPKTLTP